MPLFLLLVAASAFADPPELAGIGNQAVREGANLNFGLSATDNDGDTVTFSQSGLPTSFCTLTNGPGLNQGSIDCNPGAGTANVYSVTVFATDDSGDTGFDTDSEAFNITVTANTAPNLTNISNQSVAEGGSLNIPLSASDGDNDSLAFSESGLPGFCTLTDNNNGTGNIACNPGAGDDGSYPVTITVTDNAPIQLSDSDGFTLNVNANSAPNLTNISNQSMAEGESLNIPLSAADADPGDVLTFSQTGLPTSFCTLTDNGDGTGNIACNPQAGDGGSYNVTITVTDDAPLPLNDSDSFTLNVGSNTAPSLSNIANQSVAEGESLNIPLSATDADPGDALSFSQTGLPTSFCTLTDNGNGTGNIACNPQAGDGGSYSITITVTDDAPIPASDSDGFTLNVSSNTPPTLADITNQSMIEGEVLGIPLSASDADGDDLTFSQSGMPGFCTLTDNGNGTGSIDCSPQLGDAGTFPITVTVTDDGPVPASDSDSFTLNVGANEPPTASNVTVSGTLSLGSVLTGSYTYADAEDDPEGTSTFRWLRDGSAISGQTSLTYTIVSADIEAELRFEVTPVAQSGAPQGTAVASAPVVVQNVAPEITAQANLQTAEDTAIVLRIADLTIQDPDSSDFTLSAQGGPNYTLSNATNTTVTVTPAANFNGTLTVPVTVNDGFDDSAVFNVVIPVTAVNDAPTIVGPVSPLSTQEDTSITINLNDLNVTDPDPDDVYPNGFSLQLQSGPNYTVAGNIVTPDENYNGQIRIPTTVTDPDSLVSPTFNLAVTVISVNDLPTLETPIGAQNAVENSLFNLDVSGNFSDADGDNLDFDVSWSPQKPPNINFNGNTGVFSGTPQLVDTEPPGPVYSVMVTARDPAGAFTTDTFELTISALDRANLNLSIDVSPDTGMPSDDLRWTFTMQNPLGPQAGANVELIGSFVGSGLTVSAEGGASCTIQPEVNLQTDFTCVVGVLPVGGSQSIVLTTGTTESTEVIAFATVGGSQTVPIDPNEEDNSAIEAAGIADAFSVGAVQILGSTSVLSVAAGDINGDGAADLVVGTVAGQSVLVYPNDEPRESCDCQRDFLTSPITIPDTGANTGVAFADFDGNGTLDLVVANGGGQADMVYANDGAGNFTTMATLGGSFAHDVAVGDFNNDGDPDIAIAAVGGNPVYHGTGDGGFNLHATLGNANSTAVAVARFDSGNNRDDLVFANIDDDSRVWTKNSGAGFSSWDQLGIGDAVAVAAGDLNGDGRPDLVFGRVPDDVGDIPSNPVIINQGNSARFGAPSDLLGISPTNDVLIGDVNNDGSPDLVFINASGVHQIWVESGSYSLHREQIIDADAVAAVLTDLGFTDNGEPGGLDLAMGGAAGGGLGVYLNDATGNLGRGDTVAPVITIRGNDPVSIESGLAYSDSGATAEDNIDGDISAQVRVTNPVNTAVVGTYTVSYDVTDFAGNAATTVTRTVNVTPAASSGGGGGGSLSYWSALGLLALLVAGALLTGDRRVVCVRSRIRNKRMFK